MLKTSGRAVRRFGVASLDAIDEVTRLRISHDLAPQGSVAGPGHRELARGRRRDRTDTWDIAGVVAVVQQGVGGHQHVDLYLWRLGASDKEVDQRIRAALIHGAVIVGASGFGKAVDGFVDLAGLNARQESGELGDTVGQRCDGYPPSGCGLACLTSAALGSQR